MEQDRNFGSYSYQPVKVLDCDSISQAKDKILDVLYRHSSGSVRPDRAKVHLGNAALTIV